MKKTEKFIVLRDKNTGTYLQKYKNNDDSIACTSNWTEEIKEAAYMPEYSFKTLDGNEPEDLTKSIEEAKKETFKNLLEMFVKNSEED